MLPVVAALAGDGVLGLGRHDARRGRPRGGGGRAPSLVNDVSGGRADPLDARRRSPSSRSPTSSCTGARTPTTMQQHTTYDDVVGDVTARAGRAAGRRGRGRHRARAGSRSTRASASPRPPTRTGRCSPASTPCTALGRPVLVATSRKRFLGELLADGRRAASARSSVTTPRPRRPRSRRTRGAWCVRVHDARPERGRGAGRGAVGGRRARTEAARGEAGERADGGRLGDVARDRGQRGLLQRRRER